MRKMFNLFLVGAVVFSSMSSLALAKELSVEEIVEKANLAAYYSGDDGKSKVKMTIIDSQGRQRVREFQILRLDIQNGGEQKFYVYFNKPADVRKMVFMVWKHLGKDDDRWMYMPALDLVRRISASDKRSSFVGSHFAYEDVSGRGIDADTHQLISDEGSYYRIKSIPKVQKGNEFSYYIVTVNKQNFIPVKAEYYNEDGKLIRVIEALEILEIQGNPTVIKSQARDLERGGQTIMEFSDTKYDVGLTEEIYTERYLRRAPSEWVR